MGVSHVQPHCNITVSTQHGEEDYTALCMSALHQLRASIHSIINTVYSGRSIYEIIHKLCIKTISFLNNNNSDYYVGLWVIPKVQQTAYRGELGKVLIKVTFSVDL